MKPEFFKRVSLVMGMGILLGAPIQAANDAGNLNSKSFESVPAGRNSDLRVFFAGGKSIAGVSALAQMKRGVDFSLWIAGNQFFAMPAVLGEFQKEYPEIKTIGLITLPPGKIAEAILKGGWTYHGRNFPMRPDLYTTVDIKHLELLKKRGLIRRYFVYLHNQLSLMVARGNPKNVRGIADLKRSDLRIFLPNPIDEGIMSIYGEKVLKRHNLWEKLTSGKSCAGCWVRPNVYFTRVHHREIPKAINEKRADVGLVWATENTHAAQKGYAVEEVPLPPQDSLKNEVNYIASLMIQGSHRKNAKAYVAFLKTAQAQNAYARFGFARASHPDMRMRRVPAP